MSHRLRLLPGGLLFVSSLLVLNPARVQGQAQPRVVEAVDNAERVTLPGNVHPLARAEFDRGAASDALPMTRMLLLLKRSDEQEAALQDYLEKQQDKSSPNYHQWLTPGGIGAQYGPADADIQAVTVWLGQQGFTIEKVYSGKTVIEFSGTAAQVRAAFGTEIHQYQVEGKTYTANASDPQIPAALAPVVAGIVSLNSFPRQSHIRVAGIARKIAGKPGLEPLFTFPWSLGSGTFYGLGPGDFATIYNSNPLIHPTGSTTPTDGTGQTIAIVGETNINLQDVQNFRQMFGLPANFTSANIILNGEDPGITSTGEEGEADLDVQWSGAVAPGATVDFVVSASTPASAGIDLSALYIIEHNLAGVMSESYGSCEAGLGSAGNAFYNALWEQAAAQGITAMVSSGDGGSAGCDNFDTASAATHGLAVSGLASTPYNVAVGGTDFDQVNNWSTYWSATNNPATGASALSYIPEIPWNENCAQIGLTGCGASAPGGSLNIVAGSGGPSSTYSKPKWQLGVTGLPNDSHRDLPDVSLFASPGFNESGYIICQQDKTYDIPCSLTLGGADLNFLVAGGTSASSPAFAGVMALVNHYQATVQNPAPRQGNANYVLYALAKKQATANLSCNSSLGPVAACTFNDVTKGNSVLPTGTAGVGTNSVPCTGGSLNCSVAVAGSNGVLVETGSPTIEAWTVTPGYDLVTGLGSVNINNLATNWGTVSTVPTTTKLTLSPTTGITHGTGEKVTVNITVTPKSGTATGDVSLIVNFTGGSTQGLDQFMLGTNGSVSGKTQSLPGGSYTVTAHYAGDGTNAPSDSADVQVTVTPESSQTFIVIPTFASSGNQLNGNATSVPYGSNYIIRMYVTDKNATGSATGPPSPACYQENALTCPTGTVTLTDNGTLVGSGGGGTGIYNLNNAGYTRNLTPNLPGGTHTLVATYSGDNSYSSSNSLVDTLTVNKASTSTVFENINGAVILTIGTEGGFRTLTSAQSLGVAPTGQVTFDLDGTALTPDNYSSTGVNGSSTGQASLESVMTFPITTAMPSGPHTVTATYAGDGNYASSTTTSLPVSIVNQTTLSLTVDNPNIVVGQTMTFTAIVSTSVKSPVISAGGVRFLTQEGGSLSGTTTYTVQTDASGNTQLKATLVATPQYNDGIYARYDGDPNFEFAQTNLIMITVTVPDFSVSSSQPGLTIPAGQSASLTIIVTPATSLSSPVQLQLPYPLQGITCNISPTQVELSGGNNATATLSCSVPAPSSSTSTTQVFGARGPKTGPRKPWWALSGLLAALTLMFWMLPKRLNTRRLAYASLLLSTLSFVLGCGGGGTEGGGGGGGGGATATTTTLSVASTKVQPGANLMATVQVNGTNSPTGQVSLGVVGEAYSFNTGTLVNGQAKFSYYLGSPGGYQMTAQYTGDSQNLPSQIHTPLAVVQTGVAGYLTVNATTVSTTRQVNVTLTVQ